MDVVISVECVDQQSFRTYGPLDYDDAIEAAEQVLGLHHQDIGGVQPIGMKPRVVNLSIKREAFGRLSVQDGLYQKRRLSSGKIISVSQPNYEFTDVFVKHAPLNWSDGRLDRIFSFYGDIRNIEYLTIRSIDTKCKDYIGKRNGIVKIKIKIKKIICLQI